MFDCCFLLGDALFQQRLFPRHLNYKRLHVRPFTAQARKSWHIYRYAFFFAIRATQFFQPFAGTVATFIPHPLHYCTCRADNEYQQRSVQKVTIIRNQNGMPREQWKNYLVPNGHKLLRQTERLDFITRYTTSSLVNHLRFKITCINYHSLTHPPPISSPECSTMPVDRKGQHLCAPCSWPALLPS